jgi:hypothetical protein
MHKNNQGPTRVFNQNENKACLVPNSNCETKQTKTWHMRKKNPTKFYCKEETKIEQ